MKTMTRKNAEAVLKNAVGSVEAFNKLIKFSRNYHLLTDEQKEILSFIRKCYREEDYYMDKALSYALRNWDLPLDYLTKTFKL